MKLSSLQSPNLWMNYGVILKDKSLFTSLTWYERPRRLQQIFHAHENGKEKGSSNII